MFCKSRPLDRHRRGTGSASGGAVTTATATLSSIPMPQGTPEERTACAPDVHRFCEAALQDTMRVLACLQSNRPRISAGCNRVLVSHGQ